MLTVVVLIIRHLATAYYRSVCRSLFTEANELAASIENITAGLEARIPFHFLVVIQRQLNYATRSSDTLARRRLS
jgi:hypothetical protein